MASKRNIERGLAIQDFGRSCYCCGKGPLLGRTLFLAPVGYTVFAGAAHPLAPVCASCRTALKEVPMLRHIENLRRDARKCVATTRRWATQYRGLDFAYINET